MFGEHNGYIGNINHLWREGSFSPTVLCVSGSEHVTNGGSGGMVSTAGLEVPYQRVSQAKFRDAPSRRDSNVTFVKRWVNISCGL